MMTLEKLKQYNGQNRQKAHVAYKGNIYDVSASPLWEDGIHKKIHKAGLDLTSAMEHAPHAGEVFESFTIVDRLNKIDESKIDESKMDWVKWYRKYHPHPMFVHFPIALHIFAAGLDVVFLFHQKESFSTAVFYTFFVSTVMGVFAMLSGILSWWINYQLALTNIFIIKISFSIITLLLGILGILIYLDDPKVVYSSNLPGILYHGTVFITGITVIILAYNGGKITWPDKESS